MKRQEPVKAAKNGGLKEAFRNQYHMDFTESEDENVINDERSFRYVSVWIVKRNSINKAEQTSSGEIWAQSV